METQAKPCHQTMERQTDEQVELYAERAAYGTGFPGNGTPFVIGNDPLSEGEFWTAVSQLSHGRCGGASGICTEHIKTWLHGGKKAEDPENGANHIGAGKSWDKVCGTLLLRLDNRYHPPANVLGSDGVNPERTGGGIRALGSSN